MLYQIFVWCCESLVIAGRHNRHVALCDCACLIVRWSEELC